VRVDDHTIEVAEAPVFYRSAPADGTPTLYLHGVPTSSDDWTEFLERTGGLAPDLPGFGRSGKGGHLDYSIDGHADFVERFLEDREIEVIKLVAHDWGAAGGLVFAQRHPERVERIVLVAPVPLFAGAGASLHATSRAWKRPVLGELTMGFSTKWVLSRALRRASTRPDVWSDARLESTWEQFDQGTQRAILRLHRTSDDSALAAAGSLLQRLGDVATLIVWGERDRWLDPALAAAYGARLPHAVVETVADAGHWPWLDQPAVIDRVVAFLGTGEP
jgi:pimeloyl-ACP methyl ester carboxylesterase